VPLTRGCLWVSLLSTLGVFTVHGPILGSKAQALCTAFVYLAFLYISQRVAQSALVYRTIRTLYVASLPCESLRDKPDICGTMRRFNLPGNREFALVGQEVVLFNLHYGVVSLRLPYLLLKLLDLRLFACYEHCFLWELFKLYILRPCKAPAKQVAMS
jgi:hypothetical protein